MATDDEIRATMAKKMHREGLYDPRSAQLDAVISWGIENSDRGRARELLREMVKDDACPVTLSPSPGPDTVMLPKNSTGWVKSYILRYGEYDDLPWDLK